MLATGTKRIETVQLGYAGSGLARLSLDNSYYFGVSRMMTCSGGFAERSRFAVPTPFGFHSARDARNIDA